MQCKTRWRRCCSNFFRPNWPIIECNLQTNPTFYHVTRVVFCQVPAAAYRASLSENLKFYYCDSLCQLDWWISLSWHPTSETLWLKVKCTWHESKRWHPMQWVQHWLLTENLTWTDEEVFKVIKSKIIVCIEFDHGLEQGMKKFCMKKCSDNKIKSRSYWVWPQTWEKQGCVPSIAKTGSRFFLNMTGNTKTETHTYSETLDPRQTPFLVHTIQYACAGGIVVNSHLSLTSTAVWATEKKPKGWG